MAEQLASHGCNPGVQRLLAVAHDRIGYLVEGNQAEPEGGMQHYVRAQELLQRLNTDSPGNPEDSFLLINVYGHQADATLLRGHSGEAAAKWERALHISEHWSRQKPAMRL